MKKGKKGMRGSSLPLAGYIPLEHSHLTPGG